MVRSTTSSSSIFSTRKTKPTFKLPPLPQIQPGNYQLIRKGETKHLPEHARIYRLTHPLGEYVLDQGRTTNAPAATLHFSYASQKPRISLLEQLLGKSGWLQLSLLELDSFQHEEHLVFTAMTDDGELLDRESCEKLFLLPARSEMQNQATPEALQGNVRRRLDAALSQALEQNDKFFQQEREKLDAWAEDRILAAEQVLQDTKLKLKGLKRQARIAQSMDEAKRLQDEIEERRDALIDALEKRLHHASRNHTLFTIRWSLN